MRQRLARRGIGVGADVGFRQQVADRIIGEGLGQRRRADIDRGRGQAIEPVVGEALADISVGVDPRQRIAELVVGIAQVLHRPLAARAERAADILDEIADPAKMADYASAQSALRTCISLRAVSSALHGRWITLTQI
jgi:hypothetical protein